MLYIFFTVVFLIPVLLGIGSLSEKIFRLNLQFSSLKILLGIMILSVVWTVLAFFFPVNIYAETFSILTGISGFFYLKNYRDLGKIISQHWKIFTPSALLILFAGSFYPFILDHFGYYVPTIKWINEFGLVKGISNLDLLLGQMSVWHIFQAGFSNFSDPFLRINAVLLIIYLIYILEKKSWVHFLFLPVLFLFSQSPSPDLPTLVFSLIILNEIFTGNKNSALLLAFSSFIFIIKPTMIWVPMFAFFYSIFILKEKPKFMISGLLILLIFFIKNLWTFGYPVFPVQIGDFGAPWKPNPETLKISSQYAIQKTYDMQYSFSEIQKFSAYDYVRNWLTLKGMKSIINIAFILSLIGFGVFTFIKKQKIISCLFVSILAKSIFVMAFSAQYRFFIDVFFVIIFIILYEKINRKAAVASFTILNIFFLSFLSFPNLVKKYVPSFRLGSYMTGFNKKQFLKPSNFELNRFKTHQIGNLKFNVVQNYPYSFDTPLPAITPEFLQEDYDAKIFPQKIGKDLKSGFIWKTMPAKEALQLKKILDEIKAQNP